MGPDGYLKIKGDLYLKDDSGIYHKIGEAIDAEMEPDIKYTFNNDEITATIKLKFEDRLKLKFLILKNRIKLTKLLRKEIKNANKV